MQSHVPQRLNGIFFWSASRSQKSIALSSCEAEFISAVSGMADGIYIKRMLEAVLNMKVVLELRIDSSSARALLQRQGVQRTRHISAGLLWVQQKVEEREVEKQQFDQCREKRTAVTWEQRVTAARD